MGYFMIKYLSFLISKKFIPAPGNLDTIEQLFHCKNFAAIISHPGFYLLGCGKEGFLPLKMCTSLQTILVKGK
jgi:hypothetical protein